MAEPAKRIHIRARILSSASRLNGPVRPFLKEETAARPTERRAGIARTFAPAKKIPLVHSVALLHHPDLEYLFDEAKMLSCRAMAACPAGSDRGDTCLPGPRKSRWQAAR